MTKDADAPAVYAYDGGGRRTGLALPNGVSTTYSYDGNDRLLSLTTTGPGGTLAGFTYDLDAVGNRTGITYADGSQSVYEFDDAYRLTKETRTKAGGGVAYDVTFEYDAVGNRTKMTTTNGRPYGSDVPTEGLYHLDEPVGATSAADASGNEHHANVGSAADFTEAGRYGGAAEFDGSSGSEITIPDHADFEFGAGEFSIEAWIWIDPQGAFPMAIISKWNGTSKSWMLLVNSDGKLEGKAYSTGNGEASVVSNDTIPTGEWVHVAFERDSAGELALYVEGVKQSDTETFTASLDDTAEPVVIGGSGAGDNFTGKIDEARLSSSARGANLGEVVVNYVYNERNQLVTETCGANVRTYEYDRNGNVTKITEAVGAVEIGVEEMTYDELNRMTSYTGPRGSEASSYRGAEWHRFSHSGKNFLYDGDNVLADTSGGSVVGLYVTPFLDQNLSLTTSSATYYYSQDGLGSVRTLTDSSGTVKNKYDHTAFGRRFAPGTTVAVQQRYTYGGREGKPAGPAMYYRYRRYAPNVGRFWARDPAGYYGSGRVAPLVYRRKATDCNRAIDFSLPLANSRRYPDVFMSRYVGIRVEQMPSSNERCGGYSDGNSYVYVKGRPGECKDHFGLAITQAACNRALRNALSTDPTASGLQGMLMRLTVSGACAYAGARCEMCRDPGLYGYYDPRTKSMVVCCNGAVNNARDVLETVRHELRHAAHDCAGWDFNDCDDRACSEAWAYSTDGGCDPGGGYIANLPPGTTRTVCVLTGTRESMRTSGCSNATILANTLRCMH